MSMTTTLCCSAHGLDRHNTTPSQQGSKLSIVHCQGKQCPCGKKYVARADGFARSKFLEYTAEECHVL